MLLMKSSRKYMMPNQKSFRIILQRVWLGGDGRDVWAWIWFWLSVSAQKSVFFMESWDF